MRRVCGILGLLAMLALAAAFLCVDRGGSWPSQLPPAKHMKARPVDWGWFGAPAGDVEALPYPYGANSPVPKSGHSLID
jgi:hypothetical protein